MSAHIFDPEIAAQVGLNAAVIYQNLKFWCDKNAANDRHFHDGKYWTYNSAKAFDVLFPYLTKNQIRTAMLKLENADLITVGNFNGSAYDRTKWFCVSDQIHLGKNPNGFAPKPEPIPDGKPDRKPDDKLSESDFDRFYDLCPKKKGKDAAHKAFNKASKSVDVETLISSMQIYRQQRQGQDSQYTLHPATWLNKGHWKDEPDETPNNFHDQVERMINGNQTRPTSPNEVDNVRTERLSAPMDTTAEPDGQRQAGPDETDRGRYQPEDTNGVRGGERVGSS